MAYPRDSVNKKQDGQRQEDTAASKKDLYLQALNEWAAREKEFRIVDEELFKEFDGDGGEFRKLLLFRNGLLANMISMCRANNQIDCTFAVLALITYLSDNENFVCTLTASRMAQLLRRADRNIREAITRLHAAGIIDKRRLEKWQAFAYRPRIPDFIAQNKATVLWHVDAFSEPPKLGRPRKTPDVDVRGFSETPGCMYQGVSGNNENPRMHVSGGFRGNDAKPPDACIRGFPENGKNPLMHASLPPDACIRGFPETPGCMHPPISTNKDSTNYPLRAKSAESENGCENFRVQPAETGRASSSPEDFSNDFPEGVPPPAECHAADGGGAAWDRKRAGEETRRLLESLRLNGEYANGKR